MTDPPRSDGDRSGPEAVDAGRGHAIDRRTLLKTAAGGAAGLWLAGGAGGLLTACGGGDKSASTASTVGSGGGNLPAKVKIGVIAPMSGFARFVGEFTERGVQAAIRHITDDEVLPGTTVEYQIVNATVEDGAEGAVNAYNQLAAAPDVIGVLWATPPGIAEGARQIQRDRMPVLLTTTDAFSGGVLDPAAMPTIHQLIPPNDWLLETMCQYAGKDRGYTTTALLFDTTVFTTGLRDKFVKTAEAAGMEVLGIEEFNVATMDFGAQLQRLKDAAPQSLHIWGLNDNVAGISKGLAALDARYVDTPTAKSREGWHPHILGHPGGFQPKWAELAGDAAAPFGIMCWYLGGVMNAPEITPITRWVLDTSGRPIEGGEELAANGLWALLEAARLAGSTDRAAISEALPGLRTRFATLPFTLDPETHLAISRGDIVLTICERLDAPADTDPPYVLGTDTTSKNPAVPFLSDSLLATLFVRPTLEANLRAQPEYLAYILDNGVGIQCTKTPPDATGVDVKMTNACKIH